MRQSWDRVGNTPEAWIAVPPGARDASGTLDSTDIILSEMNKVIVAFGWIFILAFALLSCNGSEAYFVLRNGGTEPIENATVQLGGQVVKLIDIKPGESASGHFSIFHDSHYEIDVRFLSGREMQQNIGYVTHGANFHHEIVVTETGIQLLNTTVE
jgi:hypothetical protein